MIFKRLNQKKEPVELKQKEHKKSPFKKLNNDTKTMQFKGYYKGLPIYSHKYLRRNQVELFKGDEVTIITKPCIVFVLNKYVRYNGINTVLHEIKYLGDKNKTCKIRLQMGKIHAEIRLGNNQYQTLYICKNIYSDYVTYLEKYDIQSSKPPKSAYTKKLKHYYCRETFKYLGEML